VVGKGGSFSTCLPQTNFNTELWLFRFTFLSSLDCQLECLEWNNDAQDTNFDCGLTSIMDVDSFPSLNAGERFVLFVTGFGEEETGEGDIRFATRDFFSYFFLFPLIFCVKGNVPKKMPLRHVTMV